MDDGLEGSPRYVCTVCRLALINVVGGELGAELADSLPDCRGSVAVARERPAVPSGVARKAIAYVSAVKRWHDAGRPVRSDHEVNRIYRELCRFCPHIGPKSRTCQVCGCRVSRSKSAFRNKIRMATEHCPRGTW